MFDFSVLRKKETLKHIIHFWSVNVCLSRFLPPHLFLQLHSLQSFPIVQSDHGSPRFQVRMQFLHEKRNGQEKMAQMANNTVLSFEIGKFARRLLKDQI